MTPPDAVVLVSYGGPDGPDAVLPFLRNATAGRGIPEDRLAEVGAHYTLFGGVSPINAANAALAEALGAALSARGVDVPVVVGNRNWHPFLADTLRDLDASGARRIVAVLTSAYGSFSGCRQYRDELAAASTGLGLSAQVVGWYAEVDGFLTANADALLTALGEVRQAGGVGAEPRVLFVTHSLPVAMDVASGPGPADQRYTSTHQRVAAAVAERASTAWGAPLEWELVYCSRSGPPSVPWLTPDVNDRLRTLAADGVAEVVLAPIGFTSDHMEVVYDLDAQAAATASEVGVRVARAATAGTHPAFVGALADLVLTADPAAPPLEGRCGPACCGSGRPARPVDRERGV